MAEKFQVRRTCFMFTIQVDIYGNHPTLIPVAAETKCSYGTELLFLAEHDRAHLAKARRIGSGSAEVVYRGFLHLQYFVQQVSALAIIVCIGVFCQSGVSGMCSASGKPGVSGGVGVCVTTGESPVSTDDGVCTMTGPSIGLVSTGMGGVASGATFCAKIPLVHNSTNKTTAMRPFMHARLAKRINESERAVGSQTQKRKREFESLHLRQPAFAVRDSARIRPS